MHKLYVVDLETTGLDWYPTDKVVQLAIGTLDKNLKSEITYESLVQHDEDWKDKIDDCWWSMHSGLKFDDLLGGKSEHDVIQDLKGLLTNQWVTSYNTGFDIHQFLMPMIGSRFQVWDDPMLLATDIIKIPHHYHGYKYPTLEQAARYYGIQRKRMRYHNAAFDVEVTLEILEKMIKNKDYKFPEPSRMHFQEPSEGMNSCPCERCN